MIKIDPVLFGYVLIMCHLFADYYTQSDWMAMNKGKKTLNCLVHCLLYTTVFLVVTLSWKALLFIFLSHFLIDRNPIIVKRLIWLKNHLNPSLYYPPFEYCSTTGYYDDAPYNQFKPRDEVEKKHFQEVWGEPRLFGITMWLYIITDNMIHLICNYVALTYFN